MSIGSLFANFAARLYGPQPSEGQGEGPRLTTPAEIFRRENEIIDQLVKSPDDASRRTLERELRTLTHLREGNEGTSYVHDNVMPPDLFGRQP